MKSERKVPWVTLILQTLYLSLGVLFHVFIRQMFTQALKDSDIEVFYIMYLVLNTPLLIAVLGGVFLFFLWAWKYDRLKNEDIELLINALPVLPVVFILLALVYSATSLTRIF